MREPRYDDLKKLVCEIQVRTVLQDAWAIIDHHLSYKQESDVPKILRRKLNSLAGLVETAHDQFDQCGMNEKIIEKESKLILLVTMLF
jgi:ppGpp synthetase/RelA/SpoT-type nucleotidyltranferase